MPFKRIDPAQPVRPARNKRALRYYIHVGTLPDGTERYSIARDVDLTRECWRGRELGWMPRTLECPVGKRYARYGDAYKTLRRLQEADRQALTAAGRRRHVEKMAPQLQEMLREVLSVAQGAAYNAETIDRARILLRHADRGY